MKDTNLGIGEYNIRVDDLVRFIDDRGCISLGMVCEIRKCTYGDDYVIVEAAFPNRITVRPKHHIVEVWTKPPRYRTIIGDWSEKDETTGN